jgi:hypothetical protein
MRAGSSPAGQPIDATNRIRNMAGGDHLALMPRAPPSATVPVTRWNRPSSTTNAAHACISMHNDQKT